MNSERLEDSAAGRLLLTGLDRLMESRLRYRYFSPLESLEAAGVVEGQRVLEIGCGTGFFTVPAARLVGGEGRLVAIDVLQESVDRVRRRVREAGLRNVQVLRRSALDTALPGGGFNLVLLFGVIPAPALPLGELLSEVHRVLGGDGALAVWPWIPVWLPDAIVRGGLFAYTGRAHGVSRFSRRLRAGASGEAGQV